MCRRWRRVGSPDLGRSRLMDGERCYLSCGICRMLVARRLNLHFIGLPPATCLGPSFIHPFIHLQVSSLPQMLDLPPTLAFESRHSKRPMNTMILRLMVATTTPSQDAARTSSWNRSPLWSGAAQTATNISCNPECITALSTLTSVPQCSPHVCVPRLPSLCVSFHQQR